MVTIGSARQGEDAQDDVVALLLECHGRIRRFAALARRLGEVAEASAEEVRESAHRVRRYFGEALPLHVEDEEESVLPRLLGHEPALDEALRRMEREHEEHADDLAAVLGLCRELEAEPARHGALREALAAAAASLERRFTAHLEAEEALILPAIGRLLPESERDAMLRELRARRARGW